MDEVNKRVLEVSTFVEDCYIAQTKAFSPFEYAYIADLMRKNGLKRVLDIGTGNGTFLGGLAELTPDVKFEAVDADPLLIKHARKNIHTKNIVFENRLFDSSFPGNGYNLIMARFAVEHMPDVPHFISEAYKRISNNGILLITEYYIDSLHSRNDIWNLFREKEDEVYQKFGSHPRVSLELPKDMKDAGFKQVECIYRLISPSTVGSNDFYNLIISYANLYHNIEPSIFTDRIRETVITWCHNAMASPPDREEGLLISHTFGRKVIPG
jgi:SAM-dependent methyltransferase